MGKKPYEYVDIILKKDIEERLEKREEQETKKRFKICIVCKTRKSLFAFGIDERSRDNRNGTCRVCKGEQSLKYYYLNRERILSESKEARKMGTINRSEYFENYRKDNKEHLKNLASKWYKKNRKAIKKRSLAYYENNKEACQAIRKLWLEGHKEEIKKYNREYNLKKKGV